MIKLINMTDLANLEKLRLVQNKLKSKNETKKEITQLYNIDLNVILNPDHPDFEQKYLLRDEEKDHMHYLVRIKNM